MTPHTHLLLRLKVNGTITSTSPAYPHGARSCTPPIGYVTRLCVGKSKISTILKIEAFPKRRQQITNHHCVISQTTAMVIKNAVQTLYRIRCMFAHVPKHQIWQLFKTFDSRCQDAAIEMCCFYGEHRNLND
jgi:hypothetical protein